MISMGTVMAMDMGTAIMKPDNEQPFFCTIKPSSRIGVLIVAMVFATLSAAATLGVILKARAPAEAIEIFPTNGYAFGFLGADYLEVGNDGQTLRVRDPQLLAQIARAGLEKEITDHRSVTNLALAKEYIKPTEAQKLYKTALQMTRRSILSHLYFIRKGAEQEDFELTLNHVSYLLRTEPETRQTMVPFLVSLMSYEKSLEPLARLLNAQGPWTDQFWQTAAQDSNQLTNLVILRNLLPPSSPSIKRRNDEFIAEALANNHKFDAAWDFAQANFGDMPQQADGQLLRNYSFDKRSRYRPFDWKVFSTANQVVTLDENNGNLAVSRFRGPGGPIASQLVRTPVPSVRLSADIAIYGDGEWVLAGLDVLLLCASKGAQQVIVSVPLSELAEQRTIDIRIPAGCSNSLLILNGEAYDSERAADLIVQKISLMDASAE